MTVAAKTAFGAELWMAASGTTPLVKVAEIFSLTPPKPQRATIDATTHDSEEGAQEFIVEGTFDPGQIQGQVNYIGGSVDDLAMIAAFTGGVKQDFALVAKGTAGPVNRQGSCFVTEYGDDVYGTTGKQTASFTLKVTGVVVQATGAFTGGA